MTVPDTITIHVATAAPAFHRAEQPLWQQEQEEDDAMLPPALLRFDSGSKSENDQAPTCGRYMRFQASFVSDNGVDAADAADDNDTDTDQDEEEEKDSPNGSGSTPFGTRPSHQSLCKSN